MKVIENFFATSQINDLERYDPQASFLPASGHVEKWSVKHNPSWFIFTWVALGVTENLHAP